MDKCPSCGGDSMFAEERGPWIDFNGQPHYGGRLPAYCNNIMCDQRFWWHPASGRVTRRNTGLTWAQYRANRLSTCQRPHVDESVSGQVTVGEAGPENLTLWWVCAETDSQSGWRGTVLGWFYWLRGVFRLALPGGRGNRS